MGERWPRLSEENADHRALGVCQHCGDDSLPYNELQLWEEHDDRDRPEGIYVLLCRSCSMRVVEPHPRLYRPLVPNEPAPGAMPQLCGDCQFRRGLDCRHPHLRRNGGTGLAISLPQPPAVAHVTRRTKHGRRGSWEKWYYAPADGCAGRKADGAASSPDPDAGAVDG